MRKTKKTKTKENKKFPYRRSSGKEKQQKVADNRPIKQKTTQEK